MAPRANPAVIRLHVDGGTPSIEDGGDLRIATPSGTVTLSRPNIYQDAPQGRRRDRRRLRAAGNTRRRIQNRPLRSNAAARDSIPSSPTQRISAAATGTSQAISRGFGRERVSLWVYRVAGFSDDDRPDGLWRLLRRVCCEGPSERHARVGHVSRRLGIENCETLAVDPDGAVYAAGGTTFADFPVVGGAQAALNGNDDDSWGRSSILQDLDRLSSYLGRSGSDGIGAVTINASGAAYVAGTTTSTDFPLVNAARPQYGGGVFDGFVAKVLRRAMHCNSRRIWAAATLTNRPPLRSARAARCMSAA